MVEKEINNISEETELDAPALINKYAVQGALRNVTQLDLLMTQFDLYIGNLTDESYTSELVDSLISAHKKLAFTDFAS